MASYSISSLSSESKLSQLSQFQSLTYDFQFPYPMSVSISNLSLNCHPLLISKCDNLWQTRTSAYDIETITLYVNTVQIESIINFVRDETCLRPPETINDIHIVPLEFTNIKPLNLDLNSSILIRVKFWREPLSPLWLTYIQTAL